MEKRKEFKKSKINFYNLNNDEKTKNRNTFFGISIIKKLSGMKRAINLPLLQVKSITNLISKTKSFKKKKYLFKKNLTINDDNKKRKEKIKIKKNRKDDFKLFKEIEGKSKIKYGLFLKKLEEKILNENKIFIDNRLEYIKIKVKTCYYNKFTYIFLFYI